MTCAYRLISEANGVVLPIASEVDGRGQMSGHRHIFNMTTRMSAMLTTPLIISLAMLGGNLIAAWMTAKRAEVAGPLLHILLIGFTASALSQPAQTMLLGMAKNRMLAFLSTALFIIIAGAIGVEYAMDIISLRNIALAVTIPQAIGYGLFLPLYAVHVTGVKYWEYLIKNIIPPVLSGVTQIAFLGTCIHFLKITTVPDVIIIGAGGAAIYGATAWFTVLDSKWRSLLMQAVLSQFRKGAPKSD